MLEPKAQLFLNYKKEQFRYFLIACNNSIKNDETLKLQMIAEAIEETNTLRVIFQCFTYDNLAIFMTFNDFNIENDGENKFLYNYILEKSQENSKQFRTFEKEKRISVEFDLNKVDTNMFKQCSFILSFYGEGDTFEIEANDIFVGENHLSLKGKLVEYPIRHYFGFDTFNIFENEHKDIIVASYPYNGKIHNRILLSVFNVFDSFKIYDIAKEFEEKECTLVLNPYNDDTKIISNKENILEKEQYIMGVDTFFIKNQFKYKDVYATINLKHLLPFKNYAEDFDMYADYNFLIPNTPSQRVPIIHRYCGGFYIFVQDARVQLNTKVEELF